MAVEVIHGDSTEVLKMLPDESVDLVCTDPPFGYSFMGKDWDKAVPSVEIWRECLRVLKPGAFAFVMSAPRQDVLSQMIVRLTEAGFDTDFTSLYWTYASGFPKALHLGRNIGKVIAEICNAIKSNSPAITAENKEAALEVLLPITSTSFVIESVVISDLHSSISVSAEKLDESQSASRTIQVRLTAPSLALMSALERTLVKIKGEEASKIELGNLKSLNEQDISALCAELIEDWKRTISLKLKTDPTFGTTFQMDNASATTVIITESTRAHLIGSTADTLAKKLEEETKHLDGSYGGFQPKPAVEVIIVAMKPLSEKTFVDQALKNGKGVTWLDDARIPTETKLGRPQSKQEQPTWKGLSDNGFNDASDKKGGRFPANLLVSDDILNDGKVGVSQGGKHSGRKGTREAVGEYGYERQEIDRPTDSGSYSRFFSLDQWWTKACDTWPTLRASLTSDELGDIASDRNNGYTVSADASRQLFRSLDRATGSASLGSSFETYPPTSAEGCVQSLKVLRDFLGGYPSGLRLDDVHAHLVEDIDPELLRRLDDAHRRFQLCLPPGGLDGIDACNVSSFAFMLGCYLMPTILGEVAQESNMNIDALPEHVRKVFPFLVVPKASKREKNEGLDGFKEKGTGVYDDDGYVWQKNGDGSERNKKVQPKANHHPTTKPLTLMSYLITLGSRPGDKVLDPFVGSGTTVCAAKMLGRNGIGIEREEEYVKIAEARVAAVSEQL